MLIESIKTYVHSLHNKIVMRQYTTIVDKNNKHILEIVEYSYTPYSMQGKLEVTHTKGAHFDKKV